MKISPKLIGLLAGGMSIATPLIGITSVKDGVYKVSGHSMILDQGGTGYTGWEDCTLCHSSTNDFIATHIQDIMASVHWTWELDDTVHGDKVGKYNVVNNYCVAVPSNEPRCTSCHIGVGWKDGTFDRSRSNNIDCLVCHDGTGTYVKTPTGAGAPVANLDYGAILRSFQTPDRDNCGACHFYGGGAEGVKHGTMDSSLSNPTEDVDVHMGREDFSCVTCHSKDTANEATFNGSRYTKTENDAMLCQDCHTASAHSSGSSSGMLNFHTSKVACQTCHIPAMARGGKPTKTFWDWSTAGNRIDNGDGTFSQRKILDSNGWVIYDSMKGDFIWAENVMPEYVWFNGEVEHAVVGDTVTPGQVFPINSLGGSNGNGLIFPVKRFIGIQPYDSANNEIGIPNLFPPTEAGAYWKDYNWETALSSGAQAVSRSYTGPAGWIESEYLWIQNHMVAPADQAVQCWECHNPYGRLDFAALGYEAARIETSLAQSKDGSVTWRGYLVTQGWADTGDWLGMVYVTESPWIYHYDSGQYVYVPENVDLNGSWMYLFK